MTYAIGGGVIVDFADQNESQLDRLVGRIRTSLKKGWRSIIDTLNQPGNPL
jgi:hypothetical protein